MEACKSAPSEKKGTGSTFLQSSVAEIPHPETPMEEMVTSIKYGILVDTYGILDT